MIDLPRYVKPQTKPNGRRYFYYERFRGTSRAWPRVRLPFDPSSPEFWLRCHQYERLDTQRDPSGWRWLWVAESGRVYDLPNPDAGIEHFWKALDGIEAAERNTAAGENRTFRALVAAFKAPGGPFELKLGSSSRGDYDRYLGQILDAWADDPVASLRAEDAQAAIDAYADWPASARYFRAVLSRLVTLACRGAMPPRMSSSGQRRSTTTRSLGSRGRTGRLSCSLSMRGSDSSCPCSQRCTPGSVRST